jgi:mono/diheme cytochrome c family protein
MNPACIARRGNIPAWGLVLVLGLGVIHVPAWAAKKDVAAAWDGKVQPIFAQYCLGCHGTETQMAGLRLDGGDAALKGGHNGPVMIAGQSSKSPLIQRVSLPPTDVRVMPPKGNPGPTDEQIRILIEWIDGGAVLPASESESLSAAEEVPKEPIAYAVLTGQAGELTFNDKIQPFLRHYCYDCHGKKSREGGLAIEDYVEQWPGEDLSSWNSQWGKVARAITTGAMPHPRQERQPSEEERELFGLWFDQEMESRVTPDSSRASNPRLRQMTGFEYDNTVRALTGLDLGLSSLTQPGGVAGDGGFLNQGREMQLSPSKLSRYLQAADRIVAHASIDPEKGIQFLLEPPPARSDSFNTAAPAGLRTAAHRHLSTFAERAYRRPLHEEEIAGLMDLYDLQIGSGKGFEGACRQVLQGILASPQFVYLAEEHRWERKVIHWSDKKREKSEATALMADHEVASRLSYFLWSAPPDEVLMRLAIDRRLHDPEVLKAQVQRMLADPKAASLATQFAGYWLKFNKVADHLDINRERFPEFTESLQGAMYDEVHHFVEEIIRRDLSILRLLDADFTFVNEELAAHYGFDAVHGAEFQRVQLADQDGRGGLLGMAGILSLTSHPGRRSAVERGAYILREILGTPPLPPPASVGKLEDVQAEDGRRLTLAESMERHRRETRCAGCHSRMDPLGLALEEFDGIGRRTTPESVNGALAANLYALPDGTMLRGLDELKHYLLEGPQRRKFVNNFSKRLMTYALTRDLQSGDFYTLISMRRALEENEYRLSAAINTLVTSGVFLQRAEE